MQTLLWVDSYSSFSDQATLPVTAWTLLTCFLTHRVCLLVGRCTGVWKIDEVIERQTETADEDDDFNYLIERLNEKRDEDEVYTEEAIPDHLRFQNRLWHQLDAVRIHDLQLKADLRTERVTAEWFKNLFLTYNKPWLRENIHEVFTPRTIFMQREKIIDEFGKLLGPLDANQSMNNKRSETDFEIITSRSSQVNSSSIDLFDEGVPKTDPRYADKLEAKKANAKMFRRIKQTQMNKEWKHAVETAKP